MKYTGKKNSDGRPHGQGTDTDADGNTYTGEWKGSEPVHVKAATVAAPWVLPSPAQVFAERMPRKLDEERLEFHRSKIDETLGAFGILAQVAEVNHGPAFTQYLVGLAPQAAIGGKRVRAQVIFGQIADLADDLAMALSSAAVRVQSPMPGTGFVSIEVANQQRVTVTLGACIDTPEYRVVKSPLMLALGQDAAGHTMCVDLARLPNLWIVGPSGSGKSACLKSIIAGLLMANTPDQLRLLAVDAARVELGCFNGLPHLLAPVIDLDRAVKTVQWVVRELENRYAKFAHEGVRNLVEFNCKAAAKSDAPLAYWVIAIDGLAHLVNAETSGLESGLLTIASLGQAVGMHLVVTTHPQRPQASKGSLQAGFPARIEFAVELNERNQGRSSTRSGQQAVLLRGEMQFVATPTAIPVRAQCVTISDAEIDNLINFWRDQDREREAGNLRKLRLLAGAQPEEAAGSADQDDLYAQALTFVREARKASISLLQRRLRVGYTRAAKLIDALEENGVVGPAKPGMQQRDVTDFGEEA